MGCNDHGGANCPESTSPTYGCLARHAISYHKDRLGWIPTWERHQATTGTANISPGRLTQPQAGYYEVAIIPIEG